MEEMEDPSYRPDSSNEDDSDGEDHKSEEEQEVQEKEKKPWKIHVKYEKDIAITKDGLLGDYQLAATSYLAFNFSCEP